MWLWDSPKVLLDAPARAELFAFCACQGIDTLWMQVALRARAGRGRHAGAAARRGLARAAARGPRRRPDGRGARGRAGLRAHGAPRRGARRRRRGDRVQQGAPPIATASTACTSTSSRTALYRWRFPESRERMATGLVEVALESAKRLRAAGLRFGVALPFWLQVHDEQTGEPLGVVTWQKHAAVGRLPPDRSPRLRRDHELPRSHDRPERRRRDRRRPAGARRARRARRASTSGLETAADSERVWFVDRRGARADAGEDAGARRGSRRARADRRLPAIGRRRRHAAAPRPAGAGRRRRSTRRRCSARCAQLAAPGTASPQSPSRRHARRRPRSRSRSARSTSQATGGGSSPRRLPARTAGAGPASSASASRRPPSPSAASRPATSRRELAAAGPLVAGQPAFAGFALHDYEHLRPFLDRRD